MEQLTRFAWVFAVLGFLAAITSASYYFVFTETDATWSVITVVAGALFSLYLFLDKETVAAGVSSRSFRYSSGAVGLVVMAASIAIGLNMLAYRKDHNFDLTQDRRFTVSEKTISVLGGLKSEVKVIAFFQTGDPKATQFRHLVDQMQPYSEHLKVDVVNPLRDPELAAEHGVETEFGTVVLVEGDKKERLEQKFDETSFTDALIRLTSGSDHKICWMVGHGEVDPDDDQSRDGLGAAVVALENTNYTVAKRQPLVDGYDTCHAVVIAKPMVDYTAAERESIAAYVASGGRVFALLEPNSVPELAADFARYGVAVGNDLVIEQSPANEMLDMPPTFIVLAEPDGSFKDHPITAKLHSMVVLGIARSVAAVPGPGRKIMEIAHTSDQAWAETDLTSDREVPRVPDETERQGQIPVAVAVEFDDPASIAVKVSGAEPVEPVPAEPTDTDTDANDTDAAPAGVAVDVAPEGGVTLPTVDASKGVPADFAYKSGGRMVVIGDGDFAGNQLMGLGNAKDLFVNSIAWLVDEEDQIGEAATDPEKQRVTMTVVSGAVMLLTSLIFVPGATVAMGAIVMVRRRFL